MAIALWIVSAYAVIVTIAFVLLFRVALCLIPDAKKQIDDTNGKYEWACKRYEQITGKPLNGTRL